MSAPRTKSKIHDVVKEWKADIRGIHENERMQIISGEGYYDIWEALYDDFIDVAQKKEAKFSLIVGPVISVNERGQSPLFDLVNNHIFILYKAPSRERSHFRTINERLVYSENYHLPVSDIESRTGKRLFSPFIVSRFNYTFHNKIEAHKMIKYEGVIKEDDFLKLKIEEIKKLREPLGKFYDALFEDEIRILMGSGKEKEDLMLKLKLQYKTISLS